MKPVAVTGMGVVSPLGGDCATFFAGLAQARLELGVLGRHRDLELVLDHEQDLDHAQRVDLQAFEGGIGLQDLGLQVEVAGEERAKALEGVHVIAFKWPSRARAAHAPCRSSARPR